MPQSVALQTRPGLDWQTRSLSLLARLDSVLTCVDWKVSGVTREAALAAKSYAKGRGAAASLPPARASLHPRVSAQGLKANPSLGLSVFHSCKRYPPAPPMLIIHRSSSRYLATLSARPCPPERPLSLHLSVPFLCLYVAGSCADPLLLSKQAQIKTNTHARTFQLYRVCVCLRVLLQFLLFVQRGRLRNLCQVSA